MCFKCRNLLIDWDAIERLRISVFHGLLRWQSKHKEPNDLFMHLFWCKQNGTSCGDLKAIPWELFQYKVFVDILRYNCIFNWTFAWTQFKYCMLKLVLNDNKGKIIFHFLRMLKILIESMISFWACCMMQER